MILFIILLLLFVLTIYFKRDKTEPFTSNTLINGRESKRDIVDKKKNIFLENKYWRPVDLNYTYRSDITNIKLGYLPNELKEILSSLVRNVKTGNFKKIIDKSRLDKDLFLELTDKYVNQITNNINKDLYIYLIKVSIILYLILIYL